MAAGTGGRWSHYVHTQDTQTDECLQSTCFLFLFRVGIQVHGMERLTFMMDLHLNQPNLDDPLQV